MNGADEASRKPGDEAQRRFADLVKIHGLKTKFIERSQEVRLLEEGVTRYNLSLDQARAVMRDVAEENGYVFESEHRRRAEQLLSRHAGRDGTISRRDFDSTAQILRDFSEKTIGEGEARRQLKQIMMQNGWRPGRAGLTRSRKWYEQVEV